MFCTKCHHFWSEAITRAEIPNRITSCEDIRWTSYNVVLHSTVQGLKLASSSQCIICRIILNTPTEFEHKSLLRDDTEPLRIVLDIDPSKGPHPVLSVTFRESSGDAIRIPKRMIAACGGLISSNETVATLRRSTELINESTGSEGALHLANSWIQDCVANHEGCRAPGREDASTFVPTRLLDISNDKVCLIETAAMLPNTTDRRYVALSHCWGKIHIIRTLKENYETHLSHVNPEDLSKTFKDAIHATRKLGLRYIWIDSLCIKQDDDKDWAAEAATMCDVYQHATLTIAAAHASGGDVGCFKDRDGLLQLPFVIDVPQPDKANVPAHILFTSYGRGEGLGGPEPPLYGRAWVLQEQLLSPRMLVFDSSQLRWECLTTHASERSHSGGMSRHAGHQKAIRKGIMSNEEFFSDGRFTDADFSARAQHLYWCSTVMDYTHRGMTQSKDRLVALAGIAQALKRHSESDYRAGLWLRFFWAGMLWSIPHTREYLSTTMDAFSLEENKKIRHTKVVAPSWSWASVTAPVVYASPTITTLDAVCDVLDVTTDGNAAVQTGRVKIRGHMRKGYVNPVYPFAIQEAATRHRSHMMTQKAEGQKDLINFRGRAFPPNQMFLFSKQAPKRPYFVGSDSHPTSYLTRSSDWRLVRGTFRPDEVISMDQEITFLAIAQHHAGQHPPSLLDTHKPEDPLRVYTIALVPTGSYGENTGEYRRVGYAVWSDCAWYGYNCGYKHPTAASVERPGRWTPEHGWEVDDGFWETLSWWTKWDDLEFYKRNKKMTHAHSYRSDALPDLKKYHKEVGIEESEVVIV